MNRYLTQTSQNVMSCTWLYSLLVGVLKAPPNQALKQMRKAAIFVQHVIFTQIVIIAQIAEEKSALLNYIVIF